MLRSPLRYQRQQRTGAAALEFAIAITVLLMFVFASIEFVRLNMLRHSVEHASYIGARRGIVTGAKVSDVQAAAEAHTDLMQLNGVTVTVNPSTITDDTQIVEVFVEVPVAGNSWISPLYFSGSLTGRTRMLAERATAEMNGAMGL
jgi:Flp pilus assembly protein TadG